MIYFTTGASSITHGGSTYDTTPCSYQVTASYKPIQLTACPTPGAPCPIEVDISALPVYSVTTWASALVSNREQIGAVISAVANVVGGTPPVSSLKAASGDTIFFQATSSSGVMETTATQTNGAAVPDTNDFSQWTPKTTATMTARPNIAFSFTTAASTEIANTPTPP
jgi:hypothetical protein